MNDINSMRLMRIIFLVFNWWINNIRLDIRVSFIAFFCSNFCGFLMSTRITSEDANSIVPGNNEDVIRNQPSAALLAGAFNEDSTVGEQW